MIDVLGHLLRGLLARSLPAVRDPLPRRRTDCDLGGDPAREASLQPRDGYLAAVVLRPRGDALGLTERLYRMQRKVLRADIRGQTGERVFRSPAVAKAID